MFQKAITRRKSAGQNMRALAAEIGGTQGTISNVATGKIRPPLKLLEGWSKLFDTPEERDRFIKLGAATKLGPVADRALSSGTPYDSADLHGQLTAANARIAQLEAELAELRAGPKNSAMRELSEMLDPDEANPNPPANARSPAVTGKPRRGC
jgi:transcriptional regulator with XRE-family HTH domain